MHPTRARGYRRSGPPSGRASATTAASPQSDPHAQGPPKSVTLPAYIHANRRCCDDRLSPGWKRSRRVTHGETPAGGFLPAPDGVALELPEPAGESPDPCELAIAHADHARRVEQLRALSNRERLYLYLQGLGYSYTEMAQSTAASRRTVERQVLRARAKLNA